MKRQEDEHHRQRERREARTWVKIVDGVIYTNNLDLIPFLCDENTEWVLQMN